MTTVAELQQAIVDAINSRPGLLPPGTRAGSAEILQGSNRKTARRRPGQTALDRLDSTDAIFLRLEPIPPNAVTAQPEVQLLQALALAEQQPGHHFVALKWFRDTFLPRQAHAWAATPEGRDRVLRDTIARGWIQTSQQPNPKHPAFPTTGLHVARSHPGAIAILAPDRPGLRFLPVPLRGDPASETLRRMRDEED